MHLNLRRDWSKNPCPFITMRDRSWVWNQNLWNLCKLSRANKLLLEEKTENGQVVRLQSFDFINTFGSGEFGLYWNWFLYPQPKYWYCLDNLYVQGTSKTGLSFSFIFNKTYGSSPKIQTVHFMICTLVGNMWLNSWCIIFFVSKIFHNCNNDAGPNIWNFYFQHPVCTPSR